MKAKIIRGVYVRGVPYAPGAIVELSPQEYGDLKTGNYAVAATDADITADEETPKSSAPAKKGGKSA